jgi:hypothetical protein
VTPPDRYCAELLDRQAKRNTLHLRFGSAMKSPTPKGVRAAQEAADDNHGD